MKLTATFLLITLGIFGCNRDPKRPGYEIPILTDMAHPVAAEAFTSPMRLPVAGTVSRDPLWESPDGVSSPLTVSPEALARGKFVYEQYCLICHGVNGDGDGPLIPKFPNPPAFSSRRLMALSSADLYRVISAGKGEMASYAAQISREDRWKVVLYVEKLQGKSP